MAKRKSAGRPPTDGYGLIFFNVSLGLHPIRHAHIIARINAAPKGKKAAVIVDMLEHGASLPTGNQPTEAPPVVVSIEVSDDGF